MNWEAVGAGAELLAAVGVIVSLLYLAMQIRQNTESVRANTYQEFTRESAETTRLMLGSDRVLEELLPFLRGERDFDPARDMRFHLVAGLYARNLQSGFLELQKGRIDRRQFDSYTSYHVESFVARPVWKQWWRQNRKHYDPAFVEWLEARREDPSSPSENPT